MDQRRSTVFSPLQLRHSFRLLLTLIIVTGGLLAAISSASAQTANATFVYSGSNNDSRILGETGLVYIDGCVIGDDPVTCFPDDFPGTIWFRVGVGLDAVVLTAQSAEFNLNTADTFRQDSSATFTTILKTVDASGKEVTLKLTPFLFFDVAYDTPLANCPKNTITSIAELEAADTSGCLNAVAHEDHLDFGTFTVLAQDTTLPYTGSKTVSETKSSPSLDIGQFFGFPGLVGVRLDFVTNLVMTAVGGYTANREISSSSNPGGTLTSGTISWPNANPQDDTLALPCTVPAGDNLLYRLTNNRWDGTAKATSNVDLVVEIVDPIPDPSFTLVTATVFDGLAQASANNFSSTLGEILAENKPPTFALAPIVPGVEGLPINFSIVGTGPGGSFDNCDPTGASLSVHWGYDDSGSAFGKSVSHTFADNNGIADHSGHVVVTDKVGNTADRDFAVGVANIAPVVSAGPDKTTDWGISVTLHANGSDQGPIDNLSLLYGWNFNDPASPIGAAGQSVSHVFSQPGNYNVLVSVLDKDGASGNGSAQVTVTKRTTTIAYTGTLQANKNQFVGLSAQVTDEYGQPVVGQLVDFVLGTQSASAVTNGSGIATSTLRVTQSNGSYNLTASLAANSLYETSSTTTAFLIGKKA